MSDTKKFWKYKPAVKSVVINKIMIKSNQFYIKMHLYKHWHI